VAPHSGKNTPGDGARHSPSPRAALNGIIDAQIIKPGKSELRSLPGHFPGRQEAFA
jgi:hypothetical protein